MNRVPFAESACDETRRYLDSYISGELLVETNHGVLRHLEACPSCSAELAVRTNLRRRLRGAVNSQAVPPELSVRIRKRLRDRRSRSLLSFERIRWAAAPAAALAVALGLWLNLSPESIPPRSDRPGRIAYLRRFSAYLPAVLEPGLSDHIHCSVFRKYPKNPPTLEKMAAALGPSWQGLLPEVRAAAPEGCRLIMADQCAYAARRYVHLTFEKDGGLLSLLVTRSRHGDSPAGLSAAAAPSGIPIYQSAADRYHVAAFEAGGFLAYVVSDTGGRANLRIAETLAPGLRRFLMRTPT